MRMLDQGRPFGKVSPPLEIDGCEPAHYEQDGILFDAHGHPCRAEDAKKPVPAVVTAMTTELAGNAATVTVTETGPVVIAPVQPPADASPRQKRAAARAAANAKAPAPESIPAPPPPADGVVNGVDLGAWGRGQKEYLFAEVRKAVKKGYGAHLSERRDVVDFLIEQRIIPAAQARKDV